VYNLPNFMDSEEIYSRLVDRNGSKISQSGTLMWVVSLHRSSNQGQHGMGAKVGWQARSPLEADKVY
jgi:hypothetical protein